jgi:hypothetical protein
MLSKAFDKSKRTIEESFFPLSIEFNKKSHEHVLSPPFLEYI